MPTQSTASTSHDGAVSGHQPLHLGDVAPPDVHESAALQTIINLMAVNRPGPRGSADLEAEAADVHGRIASALLLLTGTEANALAWLNEPSPDLEDETPLTVIRAGDGDVVADLLEDALVGQPG